MATRRLRPYQQEAISATHEHWREWDKELLVMATGTGKTYTAKCIIEDRLNYGSVLFMAHRDELIEQARSTFGDAGKIKGPVTDIRPITVGSVQTLINRPRYDGFNTIVIDEAHHAVSDSYQRILDQYSGAKVLGLTATPDRKGLGKVFEGIAYEYDLRQAVQEGYLSRIVARTIPIDIDLTKVKTRVGDFEVTGLVEALEPYLPEIAKSMAEHAMDRKTVVFLPLVRMAQEFAEMLRGYGFDAQEVDGQSTDRKEKLEWFSHAGKGAVMCNAMLLTEGYDCPDVDCVVVLRPTKVRSLYCLDEQTEVLTRGGWKSDVEVGEEVLAFDHTTGETRFVPALAKVRRKLEPDEYFCSINGPSCDIRVTNHHRMLYDNKKRKGWKIRDAEYVANLKYGEFLPVAGHGKFKGVPLTDAEIQFIAWVMTDGTIDKANNAIYISQGTQHAEYCDEIHEVLTRCGFKFNRRVAKRKGVKWNQNGDSVVFSISHGMPRKYDTHRTTGWARLEEWISKDLSPKLFDMDERQFALMLETIHKADGNKQKAKDWKQRSYHITKGNKTFIERLQMMAIQRGYRASVAVDTKNRTNPLYYAHIKPEQDYVFVGAADGGHSAWVKEPHTDESCWCVQNELGTLVTRRNGKVAIVGNCQMIGRGTRLAPNKSDCLILDFLWLSTKHDLCRPASLITGNDEDAQKVSEKAVEEELELFGALTDVEEQRRNALADAIRANAKRKARLVDPLTFFVDVNEQALLDYVPEFPWETQPATEKQMKLIENAGINTDGMCKGQASKVIDAIFRRRDAGLATAKQMHQLEQRGFQNVGLWTFEQASDMMGRLAKNKWRVPWGIDPKTYVPT